MNANPEQYIGQSVARVRRGRGWTQERLATAMDVRGFPMHQTTVAKLEGGTRPIRVNELFALAEIFGLSPAHLLPEADPQSADWAGEWMAV